MTDPWVCLECGVRQPEPGACARCRKDDVSDLRDERIRELMRDIETRIAHRRETRIRFVGVGVGMTAVFALWLVPGYWRVRAAAFAAPFLLDQWLLMAAVGIGVIAIAGRGRPRFPYLRDDLTIR